MVGVGKGYPILTSLKVSKIYKLFISTKEYKEREEKKRDTNSRGKCSGAYSNKIYKD